MQQPRKRTHVFKVRLSDEELSMFHKKAAKYNELSSMVRDAVRYFNDKRAKCWIESNAELLAHIKDFQNQLAHIGGNVNQTAHRANTLMCQGKLDFDYYVEEVIPMYKELLKIIRGMVHTVDKVYDKMLDLH